MGRKIIPYFTDAWRRTEKNALRQLQTGNDTCASEKVYYARCKIGPQVPSTVRTIEPPPEAVQGLGVPVVPHTQQAVDDFEDLQTKHKGHQQLQEIPLTPGVILPPEHHPVRELKAYVA